jgi:endo-1,4-beta-xylanase
MMFLALLLPLERLAGKLGSHILPLRITMSRRILPFLLAGSLGLASLIACGGGSDVVLPPPAPVTPTVDSTPLRALAAAQGRYIGGVTGTAFTQAGGNGPMLRTTLAREFNMVWSGNYLKFSWLRPTATTYDFFWADSMVAFALKNNMVVRGHTLVWHEQLSSWVASGNYTPTQADSIMSAHITTVMTRYKGRVGIWDVVNEAVGDDAVIRTSSYWYQKLGPGFIERAFRLAASVDPAAKLYYNDYNIEGINAKSDAVYALLKDLIAKGVPIHGIGFQGHFVVGQLPSTSSMLANFARFAALGLTLQVTELDVRIPMPASASNLAQQATDFGNVFTVCVQTPACNAVELSNTFDAETWVLTTFPGFGSPGILDETFKRKPAFSTVSRALGGKG